jgi:hypothetical protein
VFPEADELAAKALGYNPSDMNQARFSSEYNDQYLKMRKMALEKERAYSPAKQFINVNEMAGASNFKGEKLKNLEPENNPYK